MWSIFKIFLLVKKNLRNLIFNLYYICRDKLKKIKYKKKADIIADKIIFWIKFGWKWLNYIVCGAFAVIIICGSVYILAWWVVNFFENL